ncbi:hypothetical protein LWI28_003814 [Acer negundo]|uniref:Uncharacterized protein n=1 Tax=Acer negundo TaxID=4023 RepID=A0AAD5IYJ3_ACENE|nr:hypothetical protein LWI28_003814 [Acer negundo]
MVVDSCNGGSCGVLPNVSGKETYVGMDSMATKKDDLNGKVDQEFVDGVNPFGVSAAAKVDELTVISVGISTVAMLQTKAILLPVTRFATKDTNGFFPVDLEKEEDQKTPEPFDETMRAISKGGVTDIPFRVCLASSSGRIPSVVGNGLR